MKFLAAQHLERCIGCHSCALACARLVHHVFSWTAAGIHIKSSGGLSTGFEASVCLGCDPAPCAAVCPTGAFTQRKGGGVRVKAAFCIHCGKCASACPVEAVHLDSATGTPYVCLHCGRCVPFCPHGCLSLRERPSAAEAASTGKKSHSAEENGTFPSHSTASCEVSADEK